MLCACRGALSSCSQPKCLPNDGGDATTGCKATAAPDVCTASLGYLAPQCGSISCAATPGSGPNGDGCTVSASSADNGDCAKFVQYACQEGICASSGTCSAEAIEGYCQYVLRRRILTLPRLLLHNSAGSL